MNFLERAKQVIQIECEAISKLESRIDDNFKNAIDMVVECHNRVILTGLGKSGIIARKISSTLSSTGIASHFIHLAESLHGDLGAVREGDVIICVSKSGHSPEFKTILPMLRKAGVGIISIVGNTNSMLARESDIVLDASVDEEACPNDLAPTASTTAALVLGDALAVALLHRRKFRKEDFAKLHPGGSLGRRLLLKIDDIMYVGHEIPVVKKSASFKKIVIEMNSKRFGCTCVVNEKGILEGIITDGDLKRVLERTDDFNSVKAEDIYIKDPKVLKKGELAVNALKIMEQFDIMQVIIINENNEPEGMVHLHDLLEAGIK